MKKKIVILLILALAVAIAVLPAVQAAGPFWEDDFALSPPKILSASHSPISPTSLSDLITSSSRRDFLPSTILFIAALASFAVFIYLEYLIVYFTSMSKLSIIG